MAVNITAKNISKYFLLNIRKDKKCLKDTLKK